MKHQNPTANKAPSTRLIVLLLGSLSAFGPLSIDMYLPAFTQIATDFAVPVSKVEWTLASYFAGLAVGQLFYGLLSDRFGRKRPLYAGLLIFILASIGCGSAQSIERLVLFRFFQALGSCAGIVASRAIVRDLFSPRESVRIFSLLMLVMGVAPILAPLLGGYLIQVAHWNAIFWVVASFASFCAAAVAIWLPETKGPDSNVKFSKAFHSYASVLKDREFLWSALTGAFAQSGMFAYITGSPMVFMEVFGVRPENYGYFFGSNAAGLILASQLNPRLGKVVGPRVVLERAVRFVATLGILLLVIHFANLGFLSIVIPLFFFISTMGMVFPNASANALAHQSHRAGVASAMMGTIQFLLASIAAMTVSSIHSKTALPMVLTIALCGTLSYWASRKIPKA